jgi:hypothetical protein
VERLIVRKLLQHAIAQQIGAAVANMGDPLAQVLRVSFAHHDSPSNHRQKGITN